MSSSLFFFFFLLRNNANSAILRDSYLARLADETAFLPFFFFFFSSATEVLQRQITVMPRQPTYFVGKFQAIRKIRQPRDFFFFPFLLRKRWRKPPALAPLWRGSDTKCLIESRPTGLRDLLILRMHVYLPSPSPVSSQPHADWSKNQPDRFADTRLQS